MKNYASENSCNILQIYNSNFNVSNIYECISRCNSLATVIDLMRQFICLECDTCECNEYEDPPIWQNHYN